MFSDIITAASDAKLSQLVSRIAVIVADIAGQQRAHDFIKSCRLEDEARGLELLPVGTVLK